VAADCEGGQGPAWAVLLQMMMMMIIIINFGNACGTECDYNRHR
jgi:hypothetical protein